MTIGDSVSVEVAKGARIKPAFGKVLTISGNFEAGNYQVFDTVNGCSNGTFDSADGWTVGSGWSISGGKADHSSGTGQLSFPACAGVTGKTFIVKYTISGSPVGGVYARIGGVSAPIRSTVGTYYEYITASGTSALTFVPQTNFGGSIDNVEVYMLGTFILNSTTIPEVFVQWFGAKGDNSTNSTMPIIHAIASAGDYSVVRLPNQGATYKIYDKIYTNKPVTVIGDRTSITVGSAYKSAIEVASSSVTIKGLTITGYQKDTQTVLENGIYIHGTDNGAGVAPTYIEDVVVEDCSINTFGYAGIVSDFVKRLKIKDNYVHDINYAAIMTRVIEDSEITGNVCKDIYKSGYVAGDNAYGITVTTWNSADTVRYPRSRHVTVENNIYHIGFSDYVIKSGVLDKLIVRSDSVECYVDGAYRPFRLEELYIGMSGVKGEILSKIDKTILDFEEKVTELQDKRREIESLPEENIPVEDDEQEEEGKQDGEGSQEGEQTGEGLDGIGG